MRLTFLNQNIRSMNANFDAFVMVLEALWKYPDIIVLTETWVNDVNMDSFVLEGYTAYHTIRVSRWGGGVTIFCLDNFQSKLLPVLCKSTEVTESCVIEAVLSASH